MCHVNPLGGELASGALCNRAQSRLGRCKRGEAFASAQRGGRSGEQDRSAAPRYHHPRRLARGEEACETGHFPDLGKDPRRRLDEAETDIGADVEHHYFEGPDPRFDVIEQRRHVGFDAGVDAEGVRDATLPSDVAGQRLKLFEMAGAAGETDGMTFAGESSGNGAAEPVPRADDEANALGISSFLHGLASMGLSLCYSKLQGATG